MGFHFYVNLKKIAFVSFCDVVLANVNAPLKQSDKEDKKYIINRINPVRAGLFSRDIKIYFKSLFLYIDMVEIFPRERQGVLILHCQ